MAAERVGTDVLLLTPFVGGGGGFWFESVSLNRLTKAAVRLFRVREVTCSNSAHSAG
jgi:hypothetical protein